MILGIDIGTTNVKMVCVGGGKVAWERSLTHGAYLPDMPDNFKEQNPSQICDAIFAALGQGMELGGIETIAVCGQMHGIVCWDEHLRPTTNLVTWKDRRMSKFELDHLLGRDDLAIQPG